MEHCIARIYNPTLPPVQIFFTGPAGAGKTFTLKLLMETFNRFAKTHDAAHNVYVAAASTEKAGVAITGTTVHSAFSIAVQQRHNGLTFEALQLYRNAFANVRIVFIDEISMIDPGILHTVNERLKNILGEHDVPFGGTDIVFCGDLRQLSPVCQLAIYEPLSKGLHREVLWQSLGYYFLTELMRQSDKTFSTIFTKIGNGEELDQQEK